MDVSWFRAYIAGGVASGHRNMQFGGTMVGYLQNDYA